MLARLCQLKSLPLITLLVIGSCSFFRKDEASPVGLLSSVEGKWFAKNPEHALFDQEAKAQVHNFFDIEPQMSQETFINAVVVTPESSAHSYQLDLPSGQRFYSHSYCSQKDIWNQYSRSVSKPTFTIGVLPRLLDQLGEQQRVIIFGGAKNFSKLTDTHEHRIRLLGAFIEQSCPEGNCLGKSNWLSRLVFIGMDPNDKNFQNVKDLDQLLKKVDWVQQKAVYENMDGRNGGAGATFPAIRTGNLIQLHEAMEYYKKNSIYLSVKEADKIQKNCQALYDKAWKDVGMIQEQDKPAKTLAELNAKVKLIQDLKKKRVPAGFASRFAAFTKKYYNEYTTCQKFIYAGNLNKDLEKFWFLSYYGIYMRLHKDGFHYDCFRKTWQKNSLDSNGTPLYDIKKSISDCSEKDLDKAMDYLPLLLTGLKSSEDSYYKFIDYDSSSLGTHQKLYSWVKVKTKKFDCSSDPNIEIKKETKVFPDDISWKKRDVKDIADELKIIY